MGSMTQENKSIPSPHIVVFFPPPKLIPIPWGTNFPGVPGVFYSHPETLPGISGRDKKSGFQGNNCFRVIHSNLSLVSDI
jgi:hypothetical protein